MKRFLILLALVLTGCYTEDKPKMTQAQADYLILTVMAAQFNAAQTNFTLLIVPRTNDNENAVNRGAK